MKFRVAFIGFGTVSQGLARHLLSKRERLKSRYGFECETVAISDVQKGSVLDERGLDLEKLLEVVKRTGKIDSYSRGIRGLSSIETIVEASADIVVEATWTNLQTGEPGLTHIKTALQKGCHVVTTNKGPIATAYRELRSLAESRGVHLRFEGTVLSGTPAINLGFEALAGAEMRSIRGILNGTTNFILTQMQAGKNYEDALRDAQALGYAEADPSADVDGWDAAAKIVILSNVLMDSDIKVDAVQRVGIRSVRPDHLAKSRREGRKIKLIGAAVRNDEMVEAKVALEALPIDDVLAGVDGVLNAITFDIDTQPAVTIIGPGAGGDSAGFALLSDMLAINRALSGRC